MKKDFGGKLFTWSLLAVPLFGVFSQAKGTLFSVPIYTPEVFIIIALVTLVISRKNSVYLLAPRLDTFSSALLLIALGLMFSAFANDMTPHGYGRMKSWFLFPILYGGMVSYALKKGMISLSDILRSVFWGGLWMGISICSSIILGRGFSYDHRLHGFLPSPNHLALFLGSTLVMAVFLGHSLPRSQKRERLFTFSGVFVFGILLLLTQSYAVLFSMIILLCIGVFLSYHSFSRKQLVALFLGCALGMAALFSLSGEKWQSIVTLDARSSLASRGMIWHAAARMIVEHPFFGIGPGNFQDKYLQYQAYFPPYLEWSVPHPHNAFLDLWLEGGLLGVTGLAVLFWYWLSSATKLFFQKEREDVYRILPFFLGLYFVLTGLSDVPFLRNDLMYLFVTSLVVSRYQITNVSDRSSHRDDSGSREYLLSVRERD